MQYSKLRTPCLRMYVRTHACTHHSLTLAQYLKATPKTFTRLSIDLYTFSKALISTACRQSTMGALNNSQSYTCTGYCTCTYACTVYTLHYNTHVYTLYTLYTVQDMNIHKLSGFNSLNQFHDPCILKFYRGCLWNCTSIAH